MSITRASAWDLLCEYTKSESLKKHALAVEWVMRKMAEKYQQDPELWGITGLLHDFDYEKFPTKEEHPYKGNEILKELGYPEDLITAIMGHAQYTGVPRESLMAKSLFAIDELVGFIFAVTYVRPSKSIHDVKPKSVKKKLKQKAFAASVSREDIAKGIAELKEDPTVHIQFVVDALGEKSDELGLSGANH
jgi:putative nucleotidyltransferase with HDIG domain